MQQARQLSGVTCGRRSAPGPRRNFRWRIYLALDRVAAVVVLEVVLGALALVLVYSGGRKLADTGPTQEMLAALELPASRAMVQCISVFEIVVGLAAFGFGGRLSAAAVALSFASFATLSAVLLKRGLRTVGCGCFGRSSANISPVHVVVDGAAAFIAAAAVATGVPGFVALRSDLPAAGLPQLLVIGAGAAATVAALTKLPPLLDAARLRREPARVDHALHQGGAEHSRAVAQNRARGLACGPRRGNAVARDVSGIDGDGGAVIINVLGTTHRTLFAFLTTSDDGSRAFWQAFATQPGLRPTEGAEIVVVTTGADRERPSDVRELTPHPLRTVMSSEAWDDYEVPACPFFVVVDGVSGMVIGEAEAAGWTCVFDLASGGMMQAATIGLEAKRRATVALR